MKAIDIYRAVENDKYLTVRLYNSNGEHVASLLPCGVDENDNATHFDLCNPSGKVMYCGIDHELVDSFVELFGWQNI